MKTKEHSEKLRRSCQSGRKERRAENKRVIARLQSLIEEMEKNRASSGDGWENMTLGKEMVLVMKDFPDALSGGWRDRVRKAFFLEKMLDLIGECYETDIPRFCLCTREYLQCLNRWNRENKRKIIKLRDYLNPELSVREYCEKYRLYRKFDPVERTEKWEACIEEVERVCAEQLKDYTRGMGFCHFYWYVKKDVLRKCGIEWKTPSEMNPEIDFD